jgi:hypothetical protein
MNTQRTTLTRLAFAALALTALPALAQDRPRGGPGQGPPPETLAACRGRTRGSSCTVTPPGGRAMNGTCDSPSEELPLACRPAHGPGGPGHAPPPEAFTACEDVATGDACVVDTPHGTVEGVCRTTPDRRVACAPNRPPAPRDDSAP